MSLSSKWSPVLTTYTGLLVFYSCLRWIGREVRGTEEAKPAVELRRNSMIILLIILLLLVIGGLPTWPYSQSWGYYPSGGLGLVLVILLILVLLGRL